MNLYHKPRLTPYMRLYRSWRSVGKTHEEAHELAKTGKSRWDVERNNEK